MTMTQTLAGQVFAAAAASDAALFSHAEQIKAVMEADPVDQSASQTWPAVPESSHERPACSLQGRGTLFNALIRWWTGSQYSHCELVINGTCCSSSIRDGGVRGKVMALPAHSWDVIDLPWADEHAAQQWF